MENGGDKKAKLNEGRIMSGEEGMRDGRLKIGIKSRRKGIIGEEKELGN